MDQDLEVDIGNNILDDLAMEAGYMPRGKLPNSAEDRTKFKIMITNVSIWHGW